MIAKIQELLEEVEKLKASNLEEEKRCASNT